MPCVKGRVGEDLPTSSGCPVRSTSMRILSQSTGLVGCLRPASFLPLQDEASKAHGHCGMCRRVARCRRHNAKVTNIGSDWRLRALINGPDEKRLGWLAPRWAAAPTGRPLRRSWPETTPASALMHAASTGGDLSCPRQQRKLARSLLSTLVNHYFATWVSFLAQGADAAASQEDDSRPGDRQAAPRQPKYATPGELRDVQTGPTPHHRRLHPLHVAGAVRGLGVVAPGQHLGAAMACDAIHSQQRCHVRPVSGRGGFRRA